jgi:exopolyphosphatase / guanosine-5'-triphosphate,3'-diphosphate pyrophosphatase
MKAAAPIAKQAAIIDLGSNACRLALFEYVEGFSFRQVDELRQPVRLSAGTGTGNVIRAEGFDKGIEILRAFKTYADGMKVDVIRAAATSAVRDAANGDLFIAAAKSRAGIDLEILPGELEARLGTLAVANSQAFEDALVLDLGGGSAQVSTMKQRRWVEGRSWPIGGVRMSESFLSSDPPKKKELKALEEHVEKLVGRSVKGFGEGLPLVGMGGTIRNLARIDQLRRKYPTNLLHGYVLERAALDQIVADLGAKSKAERRDIKGLSQERVDVIAAAAIVVQTIMALSSSPKLIVSGHGLREGMFYRYFTPDRDPPLLDDVRRFSVINLIRHHYDQPEHNAHVERLSLELFDQLQSLHHYGRFERDLLAAAAQLHDVGMAIEYFEHHQHGQYLVMSTSLPGFTPREQALIALLVGAHRKGRPDPGPLSGLLSPGDQDRLEKLGGMLRLCEYLERSKAQRVKRVRCQLDGRYLQVQAIPDGQAFVEVAAANAKTDLLAKAFGLEVDVILTS